MAVTQQLQQRLAEQKGQIQAAQAQIAAARAQNISQRTLRQLAGGGLAGLQARQTQTRKIGTAEQQVQAEERVYGENVAIVKEVQRQEEVQASVENAWNTLKSEAQKVIKQNPGFYSTTNDSRRAVDTLVAAGVPRKDAEGYYKSLIEGSTPYREAAIGTYQRQVKSILAEQGATPTFTASGYLGTVTALTGEILKPTYSPSGAQLGFEQIGYKAPTGGVAMALATDLGFQQAQRELQTSKQVTMTLPFQQRGTMFYAPPPIPYNNAWGIKEQRDTQGKVVTGGFYTPKATFEQVGEPAPFSEFGRIPFLEGIKSKILTPKAYMTSPGASIMPIEVTGENIQKAIKMGEKPNTWFYRPGYVEYKIAGLIPTTLGQVGVYSAFAAASVPAMAFAPLITSTIFTGYGGYNEYKFWTTPSSIEGETIPGETKASYAAGGLGLLAYRAPYLKTKDTLFKLIPDKERIYQPELGAKPFARRSGMELVYMKRAEQVSILKPETWLQKLKGYKPGQFIMREYPLIAPEVRAPYEGLDKVTFYQPVIKDGKIIDIVQVTKKVTPFPYDKPYTFKTWFTQENIRQFGLPKRSELIVNVKGRPFGLSATPAGTVIEKKGIGEAGQFYSGKGTSIRFSRLGNKYTPVGTGSSPMFGDKPYIYAVYAKGTKVVPDAYEIKVPNPYEPGGKPIKKYILPGVDKESGIFYIPTNKPEVQAILYGKLKPIRKQFYFEMGGRVVPVGEYIPAEEALAKNSLILRGIKAEAQSSSVLPYKLSGSKSSIISLISLSNISSTPSYPSKPSSSISSKISLPSIPSYAGSGSPSKIISKPSSSIISSSISDISLPSRIISSPSDYKSSSTISPPIKPRTPPPYPPQRSYIPKIKSSISPTKSEIFRVFGKRFGKDIKLIETPSQLAAETKLKSFLKTTLGRSGKIYRGETALKVSELKTFGGIEFRPAKREATRIVQISKFALGRQGEIQEIMSAKRSKTRSKKISWLK